MKIILALAAIGCICSAVYAAPTNLDDTSSDDDLGELVGTENAATQKTKFISQSWFTKPYFIPRCPSRRFILKAFKSVGSRLAGNRRNGGQEESVIQDQDNTLADAQLLARIALSCQYTKSQEVDDDDSLATAQLLGLLKDLKVLKMLSR